MKHHLLGVGCRCISYFLEPLLELAPFMKTPLRASLTGVTNAPGEPCVDELKAAWLPVLRRFILNDEALDIKARAPSSYSVDPRLPHSRGSTYTHRNFPIVDANEAI